MTFDEWYDKQPGLKDRETMRKAWNAALDEAMKVCNRSAQLCPHWDCSR